MVLLNTTPARITPTHP